MNVMVNRDELPVAVIGAGPIGLAAAAHLVIRGETPVVFEAGDSVGSHLLMWGHVRMFSPWQYNVDPVAASMLAEAGLAGPDPDDLPTGRQLVEQYLQPLADLPQIRPHIHLNTRVTSVSRLGFDKMRTSGREEAPFVIRTETNGEAKEFLAKAVIDASGTYRLPNPLGAGGLPALGEEQLSDLFTYGVPDVLGQDRHRYAGRRVMVVGSGHSAMNVLLSLVRIAEEEPETTITWVVRRGGVEHAFGGESLDGLPARGKLGSDVKELLNRGLIQLVTGFAATAVERTATGLLIRGRQEGAIVTLPEVDQVVVATGARPDLNMLRELRLNLDPALESPQGLAALIDPNVHSCGSVRPHGADLLRHSEVGFYIAGVKSYGRAPTFLLLVGYEQVRSIVAEITGDHEAARAVELTLPETGVCGASCCVFEGAIALPRLDLLGEPGGCGGSCEAENPEAVTCDCS